jgi:flavin reductase (DIM6/NTAB) family NADH-FMN oxidoreductase RutF
VKAIEPSHFRAIMGRFATGVATVTAAAGSAPAGATVNVFTALSLTPPQVLVCLATGSRTLDQILVAGSFAVNVLGAEQQALARRFADRTLTPAQRWDGVPTRPLWSGAPAILMAIAVLDCRLVQTWHSGDHTILVGEVIDGSATGNNDPLIFYAGGYRRLAAP